MKRNRKQSRRRRQTIRVWNYEEARALAPYLASVLRSLREHWLDRQAHRRRAQRTAGRTGRPQRQALIDHAEAVHGIREARDRFEESLEELHRLDVYCLDPVRGEALVPFVHEAQLAWFVFDLFDPEPYRFWRRHADALETRRPLAEIRPEPGETAQIV
jgi:hypothetical protein